MSPCSQLDFRLQESLAACKLRWRLPLTTNARQLNTHLNLMS